MKKNTRETQRTGITTLPILPGTVVLFCCTLALFVLIAAAMYSAGLLTMPEFIERLFFESGDAEGEDAFSAEFLASLSGSAPDLTSADERLLELSSDSLKELLLASTPAESYYQSMEITWTDGVSLFRKTQVHYLVSGDRVHGEIFSSGHTPKYFTCDPQQFLIHEAGESRVFPRSGEYAAFTPESEAGIPSLRRMQEMIAEAEEGRYQMGLETVMNSPCIRVRFTDPLTGAEEVFDVMPDRGLIISAFSTLPGSESQYYQMTTTAVLTDISGLDESMFDIPTS